MASRPRETVCYVGQPYVDERVYLKPKAIAVAVATALQGTMPRQLPTEDYERVRLRWLNPDGTEKRRT